MSYTRTQSLTPGSINNRNTIGGGIILKDGSILSWSMGVLVRWTLEDGKYVPTRIPFDKVPDARGVLELPNGKIVVWGLSPYLLVLDFSSGDLQLEIIYDKSSQHSSPYHQDYVEGVIPLRNGSLLSYSDDHTLIHWNWENGSLVFAQYLGEPRLQEESVGHVATVRGALETEDGAIVSWSGDGTLIKWTFKDGFYELHSRMGIVDNDDNKDPKGGALYYNQLCGRNLPRCYCL